MTLIARYAGLVVVTVLALVVGVAVLLTQWGRDADNGQRTAVEDLPALPVSVMKVQPEQVDITDRYSGIIRPFERFSVGFEIAGRIETLGSNGENRPLDEGDVVRSGQILARLDDRLLQARHDEADASLAAAKAGLKDASARLEQAQSDLNRSTELRRRQQGAISEAAYQDDVTAVAVAKAQKELAEAQLRQATARLQIALENLRDTVLTTPPIRESNPGRLVIARRMANAGESVNPHQTIMEIIQVDKVLLVVGVPEAYVGAIRLGQTAEVELLARDRFGRRRPTTEGRVYRVAEAADQTTGLFEVEIVVENGPDGRWRPGLIAMAHIVIDKLYGVKIPANVAVFRDKEAFLFAVDGQQRAKRIDLDHWVEQEGHLIIQDMPPEAATLIVRGQHRLSDGRAVAFDDLDASPPDDAGTSPDQTASPDNTVPPVVGRKP